jgi:5-methylcytosine-specific restriction endonuclease McrA
MDYCNTSGNCMLVIDDKQTKHRMSMRDAVSLDLKTPDIQRLIDNERVIAIRDFQEHHFIQYGSFRFFGDITVVVCGNECCIIDGQHRYAAMKELCPLQPEYPLCINAIRCNDAQEMKHIFVTINKAKPVPEYILEAASGTITQDKKNKINQFRVFFCATFKHYISNSPSPHRPNVFDSNVFDHINKSNLDKYFQNGKEMFEYFVYVNDKYLHLLDSSNTTRCVNKATKNNCKPLYITNDPSFSWLSRAQWIAEYLALIGKVDNYIQNTPHEYVTTQSQSPLNPPESKRRKLPKEIRGSVWRNYFDTLDHLCPLCNSTISIDDFECGHMISVKNGGTNALENLIPLCNKCNNSMSSMNFDVYCKEYGKQQKYFPKC